MTFYERNFCRVRCGAAAHGPPASRRLGDARSVRDAKQAKQEAYTGRNPPPGAACRWPQRPFPAGTRCAGRNPPRRPGALRRPGARWAFQKSVTQGRGTLRSRAHAPVVHHNRVCAQRRHAGGSAPQAYRHQDCFSSQPRVRRLSVSVSSRTSTGLVKWAFMPA